MSKTYFTTNNALTKKVWEEKLFREQRISAYFDRFMGEGADNAVQVKTNLTKSKGDKITFGYVARLSGDGVTSGQTLEDNEEKLTTYDCSVTLEQYRHGVRDDGEMDLQRAMFNIRTEAKDRLKVWGSEKIDKLCFTALETSPSVVLYPDGTAGAFSGTGTPATASAALSAANSKLTLNFITALKTWAKTGGSSRTYEPLRPIRVDGKDYIVLLVHPDNLYDLKTNSDFKQAMREAEVRGSKNPLFRDAVAVWNGVIIHEHENITTASDGGGSSVPYSKCSLFGAQALLWAWGKRPEMVERDYDYGDEVGHAWKMIAGVTKPTFNSKDYGSVGVYLARTAVSDVTIS